MGWNAPRSGNRIPMAEVTCELPCLPGAIGESGRVGFPAKNFRIPSILFILLSGAE